MNIYLNIDLQCLVLWTEAVIVAETDLVEIAVEIAETANAGLAAAAMIVIAAVAQDQILAMLNLMNSAPKDRALLKLRVWYRKYTLHSFQLDF